MSSTHVDRPKRTNAPIQPKSEETTMKLKECQTCGAHSMTNGKCDYCGNQYEVEQEYQEYQDLYDDDKHAKRVYGKTYCDDGTETYAPKEETKGIVFMESDFQETTAGKLILKIMIYTLVSIIWFAVTVFIPPLFIITIVLLVVYGIFHLTKRNK